MRKTITCEFSDHHLDHHPNTITFVNEIGPPAMGALSGKKIRVEILNVPEAIQQVCELSRSEDGEDPIFTIDTLTQHGLQLYHVITVGGKLQQDCVIFVPMANIACIHTADYFPCG